MKTQIMALAFIALVASMGAASALPEDLDGWDTPYERCLIYQEQYETTLDLLDNYVGRPMGIAAFKDFYYNYYNDKCMAYGKMYWDIIDRELTDDNEPCFGEEYVGTVNITYNGNVYEITGASFTWECNGNITLGNRYVLATATCVEHTETSAVLVNVEVYVCSILIAAFDGPITVDF